MARFPRILTTALFILLSLAAVDARKDKIRINQWNNSDCTGHASHAQVELDVNKCHNFEAQSLRIHGHHKSKHGGWIKDVDVGKLRCIAEYYTTSNCDDYPFQTQLLPDHLEQCNHLGPIIKSVKFVCLPLKATQTVTSTQTSFFLTTDSQGFPTMIPTIKVTTIVAELPRTELHTPFVQPTPGAIPVPLELVAPRGQHANRFFTYLHPFTGSPVCFVCSQDEHPDFKCQSSRETEGKCGPLRAVEEPCPLDPVSDSASSTFISERSHMTRSDATLVRLKDPFLDSYTCAKAKWKDAGEHDDRTIIKGPKKCKNNPRDITYRLLSDPDPNVHRSAIDDPSFMASNAASKWVWMREPRGNNTLCYHCAQKNGLKFECESRKDEHNCGKLNAGAESSNHTFSAETALFDDVNVELQDPFLGLRTCAEAELENEGETTEYLRIKGPKRCDNPFPICDIKPRGACLGDTTAGHSSPLTKSDSLSRFVAMKHPWRQSEATCYYCEGHEREFKCASRPATDPGCEIVPLAKFASAAPHLLNAATLHAEMIVQTVNPFHPSTTCAEAEWEDRGESDEVVHVEGPKKCHTDTNGNRTDPFIWLDGTEYLRPKDLPVAAIPDSTVHTADFNGPQKFVGMGHPWTGEVSCYFCVQSTDKGPHEHPFECDLKKDVRDCTNFADRMPPGVMQHPDASSFDDDKVVNLQDPFYEKPTCATASRKHRGKHNEEIKIKGPKPCKVYDPICKNSGSPQPCLPKHTAAPAAHEL